MKTHVLRHLLIALCIALIISTAASHALFGQMAAAAVASGFALFSLNFLLLARIYKGLRLVSQNGGNSSQMQLGLVFGSVLKFLGLIAGLYVLLVRFELSGIFVAAGSLVSLIVLTAFLLHSYTKGLETASH